MNIFILLLFSQFEFYCLTDTIENIRSDSFARFKFFLKNTSSQREVYELKAIIYQSPHNWYHLLCAKARCVEPPLPLFDTLNPNEVDSTITFSCYPEGISGNAIICLKVKALSDTTLRDSQFVYVSTVGINEFNKQKIKYQLISKENYYSIFGSLLKKTPKKGIYFIKEENKFYKVIILK
ncbi:MAG: hypothetical protein N2323_05975 [candidate division WOR-3 bacterium]|nr:hypothetical protein [candidate division WOR-3 bacterium]MCX7837481.1 hypothetical protein [candidate division WOR-3 bacterium]MDW8114757.1 hypothetical protein [candidate division WOR-3 bacterium]